MSLSYLAHCMHHLSEFLQSSLEGGGISVSVLQISKPMLKQSKWWSQTLNPDLSISRVQVIYHYDICLITE